MFRDKARYGQNPDVVVKSKTTLDPFKWKTGKLVFTCSWSDWFIEEADPWRDEAWNVIRKTPHHTYQILTKRPERIDRHLPVDWPLRNVWLGVSAENQRRLEERAPILNAVPGRVIRFLSIEPMIGPVDLTGLRDIDWIIVGGESGPGARFMSLDWVETIIRQCRNMGIPLFVKQLGEYWSKRVSAKDRKGGNMAEWPAWLRVRQWPSLFSFSSV
jgi:protein gp37